MTPFVVDSEILCNYRITFHEQQFTLKPDSACILTGKPTIVFPYIGLQQAIETKQRDRLGPSIETNIQEL